MAKTFTNDEKREIEEKAKYILTAMDDIGKNGDAYCTDEHLFRTSKAVRPNLTGPQYHTDKTLLLQAEFLHREGYHPVSYTHLYGALRGELFHDARRAGITGRKKP